MGEVAFRENRLFVFCPSIFQRTWHGVEKSSQPQKRITIQGFVELINKPNVNWHSFGLESIRYKYEPRADNIFEREFNSLEQPVD